MEITGDQIFEKCGKYCGSWDRSTRLPYEYDLLAFDADIT